jgi:hypothetical protein
LDDAVKEVVEKLVKESQRTQMVRVEIQFGAVEGQVGTVPAEQAK